MKKVKFLEVTLTDWRAQNRTVTFGDRTTISGHNGSGKSSVHEAILWVLTGYDSFDRMNYRLFDTRIEPTKENSLPASVELVLEVDHIEYRLKRIAERGWVRPRGSSVYEKKPSDDYRFEIDGVAVPVSAYKEFVESTLCPIDKLKFILNISFFLGLDWKELRKQLASIIGEVTEEDYDGDFSSLLDHINRYGSIEAAKDHFKSRRSTLRDAIGDGTRKGSKVVELATLQSLLPDTSGVEEAKKELEKVKAKIAEIDAEISGRSERIQPILRERIKRQAEIAEMEEELSQKKALYEDAFQKELRAIQEEIDAVDADNRAIERQNNAKYKKKEELRRELASLNAYLQSCRRRREDLLAQNAEVKALEFTEDLCPYCGQLLPLDKLNEARKKFLEEKESKHVSIVAKGKSTAAEIEMLEGKIAACELELGEAVVLTPLKDKAEIEARLDEKKQSYIPFEETDEYAQSIAAIDEKKASLPKVQAVNVDDLQETKTALYARMKECTETISLESLYIEQSSRITTLEEDIRNCVNELAEIEGILALFDERERQRAELIRRRVAWLFSVCEIQMEDYKKDGTVAPCCNVLVDGVPAQVVNTASKIIAGADMSNAFAKFYGLNMPLIIDNRERVDDSVDFGGERQLIELKRDDGDFTVISSI